MLSYYLLCAVQPIKAVNSFSPCFTDTTRPNVVYNEEKETFVVMKR